MRVCIHLCFYLCSFVIVLFQFLMFDFVFVCIISVGVVLVCSGSGLVCVVRFVLYMRVLCAFPLCSCWCFVVFCIILFHNCSMMLRLSFFHFVFVSELVSFPVCVMFCFNIVLCSCVVRLV